MIRSRHIPVVDVQSRGNQKSIRGWSVGPGQFAPRDAVNPSMDARDILLRYAVPASLASPALTIRGKRRSLLRRLTPSVDALGTNRPGLFNRRTAIQQDSGCLIGGPTSLLAMRCRATNIR